MPYKDPVKRAEFNKQYLKKWNKERYAKDPEEEKQRVREWQLANPDKVKVNKHNEYGRHKDKYAAASKEWKAANPDIVKAAGRIYVHKLKLDIIAGYGGRCECCGEHHWQFLTIDHIHGGGSEHRRRERARDFYIRLRREGYPRGEYRLLCISCNFSYGMYGHCPHNEESGDNVLPEIPNRTAGDNPAAG